MFRFIGIKLSIRKRKRGDAVKFRALKSNPFDSVSIFCHGITLSDRHRYAGCQ
jgi:hypothetical protein